MIFVLALAALAQAQPPTPPPQPTMPVCFSAMSTTTSLNQPTAITFTMDSGAARWDTVLVGGPNGEYSVGTFISHLNSSTAWIVTTWPNGTASCTKTTSANMIPTYPPLTFMGTMVFGGEPVNHWQNLQVGANITTDILTKVSENNVIVAVDSYGSIGDIKTFFTHSSVCKPGSTDPALFKVPSALKCTTANTAAAFDLVKRNRMLLPFHFVF
jgi:hypothetical protein